MFFLLLEQQGIIIIMESKWSAVAAIGTVLAAVVGILGIIFNTLEKTRRLEIQIKYASLLTLLVNNPSLRTVIITSVAVGTKEHCLYTEKRDGLRTIKVAPGALVEVILNKDDVIHQYKDIGLASLCNPEDKIEIIVRDSYNRRYRVRTELTVDTLNKWAC